MTEQPADSPPADSPPADSPPADTPRADVRSGVPPRRRPPPSLLYAVKQVELAVRSRLDDMLRPAGVTALQYTALTVLERRDGMSSSELARNAFVTPQAMADLVTALERHGLVVRRRDPVDRRRLVLDLTHDGHRLLGRCAKSVAALETRMVGDLGRAEREQLRSLLNRCRENLQD